MSKLSVRFLVAVICILTSVVGSPQMTQGPDTEPLRFEVVSIRPSGSARGTGMQLLPDGFEAMGMPLLSTIQLAYVPAPFFKHLDLVKGAPPWAHTENYDIRAKVATAGVAPWQSLHLNIAQTAPVLQEMLRAMLAERCNLRIHGTETMIDGYVLRLGSKSPALVESSELPVGDQGFDLIEGAKAVRTTTDGEQVYTFYNTSMRVFASYLSFSSQYAVQDRTSLSGRYKFVLPRIASSTPEAGAAALEVSVPWDLRSIGLKVDRETVKSTLWTVDSIEKPSPN